MKRYYKILMWIVVIILVLAGCVSAPAAVEEAGEDEEIHEVSAAEEDEPVQTDALVETKEPVYTDEPEATEEPKITEEPYYPSTPEEVWGALIEAEGGLVWKTLTEAQQALINYPKFDESKVYWTKGGSSYHAIDWCYTLGNSKSILSGTLEEAKAKGKTDPCSKCVGL